MVGDLLGDRYFRMKYNLGGFVQNIRVADLALLIDIHRREGFVVWLIDTYDAFQIAVVRHGRA